MGTFFICMIKSAICLVVFYLFYKLLLSKDTFHRFNRIALLSLMLLSFLVPLAAYLFQPTKLAGVVDVDALLMAGNATIVLNAPVKAGTDPSFPWIQLLILVYLVGVLVYFIRQAFTMTGMFKLMKASRQQSGEGYTLYVHDKKIAPFSWMKRIVVSNNDLNANKEKILAHEWAHIRLRHSWDLLLVDICLSFQWFNPASWLLKQELQSIHEFEADDVVLRQGIDAKQYQLLLIEKAVGTRLYSMANSFNHSSLKKRITMMLKEKSNPWARLKYLYVLPLTCVTVLAFARPEVSNVERQSAQKIDESIALAKTEIGNLASDKITEFSGMDKPKGIKNKDLVLAQASNKPTVLQIVDVQLPTEGSTTTKSSSTTGNSKPLLVVNRIPYNVDLGPNVDFLNLNQEQWATMLSIKPDDILSITVLKDAAATAIWGNRGAKGVIEITTKNVSTSSTTTAFTHSVIVRGKVVSTDKQPLSTIGVMGINEEGRAIAGTITNNDGTYVLKVTNTTNRLQFFKSGYKTLIVPITDNLIVTMVEETSQVGESDKNKEVNTSHVIPISVTDVVYNQKVNAGNVTAMNITDKPDQMPEFPGGNEALMNYIGKTMRYPAIAQERGIQGRVVCSFVITAEGAVVDARVVRGLSPEIDSEAIRCILNLPKWIPGKKDGVNVAVSYTIPIVLTLNTGNKDN